MVGAGQTTNRTFFDRMGGLRHRLDLIGTLTVDEITRAYSGSVVGLSWILIKPMLLIGLYGALFGYIFQTRGGPAQTGVEYVLVLLTGLLPWLIFSEAVTAATGSITSSAGLVTKVLFPIEVLPITKVLGATLSGLIGLLLLLLAIVFMQLAGWTVLLVPLLLAGQLAFTLGLGWFLSAINVAVRDTSQILPLGLMVWMFLSPVVYTKEMVPTALGVVFAVNPMSYFLEGYRVILLSNQPPTLQIWFVVILVSVGAFLGGFWVFDRMRPTFADFL
jgi:lipopolysaccharide transport system permease protein